MASTHKLLPQIDSVPLLIIHSEDDTTVLAKHSLVTAKEVNRLGLHNILVVMPPDGGHIAMHKVDPNWTFNMVYGFHYYYAFPNKRNLFIKKQYVGLLWYYFDPVFDFRMARMMWTMF